MRIENVLDKAITIKSYWFDSTMSTSQLRLVRPERRKSMRIQLRPYESVNFEFEAKARFFGAGTEYFSFRDTNNATKSACFQLELLDETGEEPSIGTGPNVYKNTSYTNSVWNKRMEIIPGVKLNDRANFIAVKIGSWDVPMALRNTVLGTPSKVLVAEELARSLPFLGETLTFSSYEKTFHALLYLEEIQVYHTMRRYDRDRAHFIREGEYLALHVANIAESRPSLVLGDFVLATNPFLTPNTNPGSLIVANRGDIHKVLSDRVLIRFNDNFHSSYNNEDWRLEFHCSRMGMRKCHFAIQKCINQLGPEFLFPSKINIKPPQLDVHLEGNRLMTAKGVEIPWFNTNLNIVQKEAVVNVLRGEARPMPYVLFGPPGTGKTSTLIETILQICTQVKDSRLLVAAPSNSAANTLTQRIAKSNVLQPGDFVRLAGYNAIEAGRIPEDLLPFTVTCEVARDGTCKEDVKVLDSGVKLRCGAKMLGKNRITIGTCSTLGTLMQMEFVRDHFTHVLIDECGQCLEPEAMIPITFLSGTCGQVVLAGDPMQLGPVVLSRYAIDNGLATSFLVRILARFPYLRDYEVRNIC